MSEYEQSPPENLETFNRAWQVSIVSAILIAVLVFGLYLLLASGPGAFFGWLIFATLGYGAYRLARLFF